MITKRKTSLGNIQQQLGNVNSQSARFRKDLQELVPPALILISMDKFFLVSTIHQIAAELKLFRRGRDEMLNCTFRESVANFIARKSWSNCGSSVKD